MNSNNQSNTMKSKSFEGVNLYDAESDTESGSSYDVINHPVTPISSQSEATEKSASLAEKAQDSRPALEKKTEVSFATKVQADETEKSKFVHAKPLTDADRAKIFFAPSTGPTSFLNAIAQGNATLKGHLSKRSYDEVIGEIESMFEYFCQQTDKHQKEASTLQSKLDYVGAQRDVNFSKLRGEITNGERKDEQIKTMQKQTEKLEGQVKAFNHLPEQVDARAYETEKDARIEILRTELKKMKDHSWTRRQETDALVRNAKYRCDVAERKIKRNEDGHRAFVKKLGEAHASVTSSLLGQVGEAELKLADMTKQFESMERRATVAYNMREGYQKSYKEGTAQVARLQEQLKAEIETQRSLRHQLVDVKMAAEAVEQRMRAAEKIVGNVNNQLREVDGELRVVKEEKAVLEQKLEEVKAISVEMGEIIVLGNQLQADREAENGDEVTIEVREVSEGEDEEAEEEVEVEGESARPEFAQFEGLWYLHRRI